MEAYLASDRGKKKRFSSVIVKEKSPKNQTLYSFYLHFTFNKMTIERMTRLISPLYAKKLGPFFLIFNKKDVDHTFLLYGLDLYQLKV